MGIIQRENKTHDQNDLITVCLITCGETTEQRCLEAIEPHRHKFTFQKVSHVYPQSAACNQMIAQTTTKYVIPLDSDMILYPNFFERIQKAIVEHSDCCQILFPLWDTFFEKRIPSLKVLLTEVARKFPFKDVVVPDLEHVRKLQSHGYKIANFNLTNIPPIGDHIIQGNLTCYAKLKDNYLSYRINRNADPKLKQRKDFDFFTKKFSETKNEDYLYAIAGMMDGILSKERNSKNYSKLEMLYTPQEAINYFTRKSMII